MQPRFTERGRNKVYSARPWYKIGLLDGKACRDFVEGNPKDYEVGYNEGYAIAQMRNDEDENRTG